MLSSHVYNWQHYVVEVMNIKLYVDVRTQAVLGGVSKVSGNPLPARYYSYLFHVCSYSVLAVMVNRILSLQLG